MPVSSADSRVADWAVEARDIWDRTQDAIRASKERMRSSADAHRRPAPTFAPGDLVWLSARNIRLRVESTKFAPCYLGPFKVLEQVNPVVYRLALPPRLGITDTFHVSLLKPVYMSRFSESSTGTSVLTICIDPMVRLKMRRARDTAENFSLLHLVRDSVAQVYDPPVELIPQTRWESLADGVLRLREIACIGGITRNPLPDMNDHFAVVEDWKGASVRKNSCSLFCQVIIRLYFSDQNALWNKSAGRQIRRAHCAWKMAAPREKTDGPRQD
ncbi:unnamed protein product, partial [Ranitomeya imitator]